MGGQTALLRHFYERSASCKGIGGKKEKGKKKKQNVGKSKGE